jgi:hypothetical protein
LVPLNKKEIGSLGLEKFGKLVITKMANEQGKKWLYWLVSIPHRLQTLCLLPLNFSVTSPYISLMTFLHAPQLNCVFFLWDIDPSHADLSILVAESNPV